LRSRFNEQGRELEEMSGALAQALSRVAHSERVLSQAKSKLVAAQERVDRTEAEAAGLYARLAESEAKLSRAASERENALAEARDQLLSEREESAAEVASLRDALAAALERERAFRRVEAELGRKLAALSGAGGQSTWEREDERATLRPQGPVPEPPRAARRSTGPEILVDGLPLVP
jgi:ABC-type transporter Mla subunit MlaD